MIRRHRRDRSRRDRPARGGTWLRWCVIGLAATLVAAACSGDSDEDDADRADGRRDGDERPEQVAPEELSLDAEGFYEVPDPLPAGEHGDLLRYQEIAEPVDGTRWYRVMYLSETVAGGPTVVTGIVTVPAGQPPEGGWRTLTHGHGGFGIADECAPSISLDGDRQSAAEMVLLSGIAPARGYVVASTDYEGLGGPGSHPFLVGESEARGVLDIARAVRQLPGVEVSDQVAIAGYSQGGHSAMWASQIAAEWTPDLDVVGTMAGAPATELVELLRSLPTEAEWPLKVSLVVGYAAAYPDADRDEILTDAGRALADDLEAECVTTGGIYPDQEMLSADPLEAEPWATLIEENTPGATAASSPVLIIHSAEDANVPVDQSATLLDRLCESGQTVERRVLPTGDHVAAAVPAYEQALDWFDALTTGTEPTTSCP